MGEKFDPRSHIGEVHGIYTIVDMLDEKDKYGHWIYQCVCNECGFIKESHYGAISGEARKVTSCKHRITHWNNKRIGNIFVKMVERCCNSNSKDYKWYGGKGIKIYEEWLNNPYKFEEWAINNGYNNNLTIDRINESGDYCPENCQWIPLKENARKAGDVNWINVNDEVLTGRQWSEKLGLGINTINTALRNCGLTKTIELIQAMLQEPPSTKHRKSHQTWFSVYGIQV